MFRFLFVLLPAFAVLAVALDGVYVIDEGNVGVITKWGKAVGQEGPEGLRFKTPITTGVVEFDARERQDKEELSAATANQLPINAVVSVNWLIDPAAALDIYVKYGTPSTFAQKILTPRVRQAAKAGLSRYQASDLIRDRQAAASEIEARLVTAVEAYPVQIVSFQIENVDLPARYLEAVMAKEEAREAASREQYKLDQQKLEAQRQVQSAEAARDATKAAADGQAYRVRIEAEANADAIRLEKTAEAEGLQAVADALAKNPALIAFEQAQRWDGVLPQMMLGGGGDGPGVMMQIPSAMR